MRREMIALYTTIQRFSYRVKTPQPHIALIRVAWFCKVKLLNDGINNNNNNLGRRLSEKSGESRETSFLFQRCSVLSVLQRFNAVLLHDSMPACDRM